MTQITDSMMEQWNLKIDELHRLAVKNMDPVNNYLLQNLSETLQLTEDIGMYMLTNRDKINGASMIVFDEIRQKIGRCVGAALQMSATLHG